MSIHYKNWKTISFKKSILGIVKRGLVLNFKRINLENLLLNTLGQTENDIPQ